MNAIAERPAVGLRPAAIGLALCVSASHLVAAIQARGWISAWLIAVGVGAAGWAWWTFRTAGDAARRTGVALALAPAAVWACSRIVGLPFGLAPRAPIGPLDAVTVADELLLALVCLRRWPHGAERLAVAAFATAAASLMLLSMGCDVGAGSRSVGFAGHSATLLCHLY